MLHTCARVPVPALPAPVAVGALPYMRRDGVPVLAELGHGLHQQRVLGNILCEVTII